MTKRKLMIIVFMLLAGTYAWAQRDYRKGYIITNQQDTVSAGAAAVWMPDGKIKEITERYHYEEERFTTKIKDFPTKFFVGYEVISGVHYYLTPKRIAFLQVQYLQCYKRQFINLPGNVIRSFGLASGIYF